MDKRYIRRIVRKLKCPSGKRKEIKKQLISDFMAEEENGVSVEQMKERLGTPAEIAAEFNSGFSDEEKKKWRREKWGKRLSVTAVILALLIFFIYWALPKSGILGDSRVFREDEVKEQARHIIELLDAGDYDALQDCSTAEVGSILNKEDMEKTKAIFGDDWGDFQSFGRIYVSEVQQMEKHSAVVQMSASYEKVSITYTLSFDEDMKLAGFWMK